MRRAALFLIFLVACVLAGCTAIPTSGPVTRVEDSDGLGESTVRYTPTGPAPGASELQIVRGYLDAMLAYPVTHRVVAEYLTPDAAQAWRPGRSTTVYSTVDVEQVETGTVRVDLTVESELDSQGRLTRREERRRVRLELERVDGHWRIIDPPDGLLVSRDWFDDYVRPFDLYFLDETGTRVVPVPVYEVVGDQLATSLMTSLAIGPGESDHGLTTAVPPVYDLRSSVPVVGGVAEVDFDSRVAELPAVAQERLSAQVAWTLRQVPAVRAVQITGSGTVVAPLGEAVQDAAGWTSYGPDKSRRWTHAVVDDAVYQVGAGAGSKVSDAWGRDARGATMVALDDDRAVAVWSDRAWFTDAVAADPVAVGGRSFLRPVIDIHRIAWAIDAPDARARVRVFDGERVEVARTPGLPALTSFAVSANGARYAATTREGGLVVGRIVRARDGSVRRLTRPDELPADRAREVVWIEGTRVAHLGAAGTAIRSIRIDGSGEIESWPGGGEPLPAEVTAMVATPSPEPGIHVMDAAGRIWAFDRARWIQVSLGPARGLS